MEKKKIRSFHIMFIDNDKHVRDSLKVFFENSQTKVLIFKSASEGLNSLKYHNVDVVISDYFLADMDGIEFLTRVAKIHPDTKRILMATITIDDLEQQIVRAGIDRFIEKPLSVASLDTIINELKIMNLSK
ncbi:MAG: hypothetical protein B6230_00300 [Desulfobacteraceae bacterium 4572_89]|nr:MAG: hypothetical protein B6230_00300 [Desulfobacteraceae bacterium 4572_89]